ncbi:hypothetical protein ROA7450_03991 [Roseovarius albus]|uniref:TniQ domain-containing protein n=2 Tax=Roseovarius albus TaxID=1247867 RepID=A0A1X7A7I7_9RHOB|nr:hypothetical protein ROA7450_03991 [Roseovarius albus]
MNGVSATNFALDMGFSLKRFVEFEEVALSNLSLCGGLTDVQLEELMSWTGQSAGDVRMTFRGEEFVSRALRNPIIRGCPVCLQEDIELDRAEPLTQMMMRGDWQLRAVNLCVKHCHPIVPLWEQQSLARRYDLSSRFADILRDLQEGRLEQPRVNLSPYDLWLDTRLQTGADDTWLANHTLYAATTFCELLGKELLRLENASDLDRGAQLRLARTLGFRVACQGEAKIRAALNELATLADGANARPQKAFGRLYIDLNSAYLDKSEFAPFRKILRDCIVEVWPVAAGETVLGAIQTERQLHSILTASQETGIGEVLLEQFLVHAGAIDADDDRPTARKTFDALVYADLLAEIPTLVGPIGMQRAMGATKGQLASLAQDGVLVPRINTPKIKSPWRASDGIALVAELRALAIPIEPSDKCWEGMQAAKKRSDLGVGEIITEVRAGKLKLGRRTNLEGYAAFCVLKEEIDQVKSQNLVAVGGPVITAAAFGRRVGIRTQGWFEKLAAAGHTPATSMPHPKYGGEWIYASVRDIEVFHKRFLTTKTMKEEFERSKKALLLKLEEAKVQRFSPNGEDYGPLYLREDVEPVLG